MRWLPLLALGCAADPCPDGSMLQGPEGLIVTEAEHGEAYGQPDCTGCHAIPQLHRQGCTPEADAAEVRAVVEDEGAASCAACHGANGVEVQR